MKNKKILIAICGGIAAYKINYLVRDFMKLGAEVKVILTPTAEQFVSKLTLSTLSKNKTYSSLVDDDSVWNNHVELALWADCLIVAPCTANTLAKMAMGLSDNFLLTIYLSFKNTVFIAPAMDLDMYAHPATKENLKKLKARGNLIIPVGNGELASGLFGEGRMAEPEQILEFVQNYFSQEKTLQGKKVLITAGPTYEAIDPVRFIGNHSSGKMGYYLAHEAVKRGAQVILISGPSSEKVKDSKIELHRVVSAKEMYQKVFEFYHHVDLVIASAAVADYRPQQVASEKIKKNSEEMSIRLVKNPDILKRMGKIKNQQILVGFALETENEENHAKEKLRKKNLDMIVLNSLKDQGAGFKTNTNKIQIFTENEQQKFELKKKEEVAKDVLDFIEKKFFGI